MRKRLQFFILISLVLIILQPGITTKAAIDGGDVDFNDISSIPLITEQNVVVNSQVSGSVFSFIPAVSGSYTIIPDYGNPNIMTLLNNSPDNSY
jgi:hypothetical protein